MFPQRVMTRDRHKNVAELNKLCESSQTKIKYKTNGDQKAESIEHSYICVCERGNERERESAVCGIILNTLVVFSV